MMAPDVSKFQYPVGEEALLKYLLHNQEVDDITNRGDPHLFYDQVYRGIFEICKDYAMTVGKGSVNCDDIFEIMKTKGKGSEGIKTYITQLATCDMRGVPTLDYIFDTLTKHSTRRQAITQLYNGLMKAQDPQVEVSEVVADTEDALLDINKHSKGALEVVLPNGIAKRRHDGLLQRYNTEPVYTGWQEFDKHLTCGFAPGKLSIIAGRTSMGKSFFKTNIIINMANRKIGVINICPEQGFDSEHDRIDSIMTGTYLRDIARIKEKKRGDKLFSQLKAVSEHIQVNWNYACVPTRGITVPGVQAAIRRARRGGLSPQIVFIDLFDRLSDVNVAKDRTANIVSKMGQIEQIAQEENVHVCLLVQIGRAAEQRTDKQPELRDLKDCSAFENDSDIVFLLYRQGYYDKDLPDNTLEVHVAKQRDGAPFHFNFLIADKNTLALSPVDLKNYNTKTE